MQFPAFVSGALVKRPMCAMVSGQRLPQVIRTLRGFWLGGLWGPYSATVPARRTMHLRFNDLQHPEPIPRAKDYASVIESDVPIVVQHTRLDSRQDANALLSTIAYSRAA